MFEYVSHDDDVPLAGRNIRKLAPNPKPSSLAVLPRLAGYLKPRRIRKTVYHLADATSVVQNPESSLLFT